MKSREPRDPKTTDGVIVSNGSGSSSNALAEHRAKKSTVTSALYAGRRLSYIAEYCVLAFVYVFVCFSTEVLRLSGDLTLHFRTLPVVDKLLNKLWKVNPVASWSLFSRMQHPGYFTTRFSNSTANPTTNSIGHSHAEHVLDRVKRGIRLKMDKVFDAYLTGGDSDFPSCESPVWIFGRSYSVNYDIEELRRSVSSCMWITYRKNFQTISGTSITSDKGWGCMIRAGQMLVAKALLLRHLSQDWHWDPDCNDQLYLQIVSLFEDTMVAPLSLHQIAQSGASLGKPIGSWLGPNTVAQALKKILSSDYVSLDMTIQIAMDSTVVKSEIKRACRISNHSATGSVPPTPSYLVSTPRPESKWKPLLLVVPLRLGLSDLNEAYVPGIKAALEIPQTIGIIGGRPNHALYFIGYAANEVLYLDPHTVQPAVFINTKRTDDEKTADETYHIQKPGRMSFSSMDPSIAVCFFCKTENDFDSVCNKLIERFQVTPLPLFEICEGRQQDWMTAPVVSTCSSSTSKTSKKSSKSSSLGFTTLSLPGASSTGTNSISSVHSIPKSTGGSPSSSISGRSKSDIDDEDFEILG